MKLQNLWSYLIERGKEPSTWAGFCGVFVFAHVHLTGEQVGLITAGGVFICGALAAALKE